MAILLAFINTIAGASVLIEIKARASGLLSRRIFLARTGVDPRIRSERRPSPENAMVASMRRRSIDAAALTWAPACLI